MSLSLIKTPELTYQEACEFFEYKKNKIEFQNKIKQFEEAVDDFCKKTNQEESNKKLRGETEGAVTHNFADGLYIRTLVMPKDLVVVTKLHAKNHPFFIMKGEASIFTEQGVERIKAPFHGITETGTKRALFIHEECTFITVHRTDCLTIEEVENEVIAKSFDDLILSAPETKDIENLIKQLEGTKCLL